jgi:predicted nucleotidyltransferase
LGSLAERRAEYALKLERSLAGIVRSLSAREDVRRISVFGSYARGRRDLFTDLDLIVIMDTREPFVERMRRLYALVRSSVDLDMLCYTPEEWERLKERPFFRHVRAEEVVLYEAKPRGRGPQVARPGG